MTKKLLLAGIAAAVLGFSAAGAQAAVITGLFDTGVDAFGATLAEGATDTHYLLNGTSSPFVYDHPAYVTTADARFIAAQVGGGYAINPNTYSLTFDLGALDPTTAQLSGSFEADNFASIYLNGHLIGQDVQGTVYSNFQSLTAFNATSSSFVAGLNTLSFVVTDTGPPAALLVSGLSGTASSGGAVPEPTTWGLMMVGFGGLGAVMRTRRRYALTA
jgi:hypothetical protein